VFALQKLDFFFCKVETDGFGGNQDGATGGAGVNEVHSRSHVCCLKHGRKLLCRVCKCGLTYSLLD
jgi:hypothetical protein